MFSFNVEINTQQGRSIVSAFSMSINQGDKIALIGEEGNGKTTFLKSLLGNQSDDFRVKLTMSPNTIIFGYIQQSLAIEEMNISLIDYVIESDWSLYGDFKLRMKELLQHLKEDDYERSLKSFSKGELVRIQIIKLLLNEVDCYLLDEPSNDLDLKSIIWLEEWIQAQEKPLIVISHDLRLIENTSNRIIHFEQTHRKTRSLVSIYEGDYRSYIQERQLAISKHNQDFENKKREKLKQEERWRQLYDNVSHNLKATKGNNPSKGRLLAKKMKAVKSQKKNIERDQIGHRREQEEAIRLKFYEQDKIYDKKIIDVRYPVVSVGDKELAHDINFNLRSMDKIALVGRNGVGKTTFIKKLSKEFDVEVMHQDYSLNLDYSKTPLENLWTDGKAETKTRVSNHLGSLNITGEEMNVPVKKLSEGQKAKCSLLKVVLGNKAVIILDEPTRNLSPLSVSTIYDLINDFPGAILAVTHDRALIDQCFDKVLEFTANGLVEV